MRRHTKSRLGAAALLLWVLTIIGGGIVFVRGSTQKLSDGRTAVVLSAPERDFVLGEMRGMLETVQTVTAALAAQDRAAVIAAARRVGASAEQQAAPLPLMAKLPLDFKTAGMAMHAGFDEIATAAENGEDIPALTARLSAHLSHCLACHQAWRLEAQP